MRHAVLHNSHMNLVFGILEPLFHQQSADSLLARVLMNRQPTIFRRQISKRPDVLHDGRRSPNPFCFCVDGRVLLQGVPLPMNFIELESDLEIETALLSLRLGSRSLSTHCW